MARDETTPDRGRQRPDPADDGCPAGGDGIPVVVTLVETPACHLCADAKSVLAVLAQSYSMRVEVLPHSDERGRALMLLHRAPMSPLILLDGVYFSAGRLPRRKLERRLLERRLAAASRGETSG